MDRFSHSSFENPSSSSDATLTSSEFDFDDVFGGPPRRSSSIHEIRNRSGGSVDFRGMDLSRSSRYSWSEKTVFGDQSVNCSDFFDDIFRGDESYRSQRMSDRDQLCSDPFGSPFTTAHFSHPAKLNRSMDLLPAIASGNSRPDKNKDDTSSGTSYPYTLNTSLSRFSSQSVEVPDELSSTDVRTSFRKSRLSHQFSLLSDESSYMVKSAGTKLGSNLEEDPKSPEAPINSSPFHFSMYNWSCRKAPVLMPLQGRNGLKSNERGKFEKSSSSKGRIENDSMVINCVISANTEESLEGEKQHKTSTHSRVKTCQIVDEEAVNVQCTVENILGGTISSDKREETKPYSFSGIGLFDEPEEKVPIITQESGTPEEKTRKAEGKENEAKLTKPCGSKNVKKLDGKRNSSNGSEVNGKVKEFVKIFNQEASSKPRIDVHSRSQSCRWERTAIYEANLNTSSVDMKMADVSIMVDKNVGESENRHSHMKTTINESINDSYSQKNSSSSSESAPHSSNITLGNMDDPFQVEFLIEELPNGEDKFPETGDDHEAIQVSDAKIQQWSDGKQGNIRSLLSTLQYVLWDESGWKAVALVDIIEASAVKRAYQKALLCLHPDKLQQKGTAAHKKYIAQVVFDTLQEAWDHFNLTG